VLPRDQRLFDAHLQKIENDSDIFKDKDNEKDAIFIVKPENACQGKGIFLIRDLSDMERQLTAQNAAGFSSTQTSGGQQITGDYFHCVI